ncbi:DUF421 domain-containing protein [Mucilaginibacter aquatilis]|uniref:DUF421 domain-containing protein n=1 Tax=Mucilaginibacter aquatilis TaxID=1517760 RepID=A0A6I4I9I1_9SPHI|nr:YetF domain-containing protein [Mucilaginibacter aquatilis]MVN91627.1 DUF421 domain-containing protein [Mucilaginibacter aquatilis]
MKPGDIKFTDWGRWLYGDVPAEFYTELVIRAAFIYIFLMVAMRLLGKRMSSQLSRNEMAALVTLAAAIGIPLQTPERGLLPAIIIGFIVVYVGKWIAHRASNNQDFEKFSQGNIDVMIKDSVMELGNMKRSRITRERLVAELRSSGIKHLGEVKRLYMEANGTFTLIKQDPIKPGLVVLPLFDHDYIDQLNKPTDITVCGSCGLTRQGPVQSNENCSNCNKHQWTDAVQ